MFQIPEFTKLPIIIISPPRCGSGALGHHLEKTLEVRFFNEPNYTPDQLAEFLEFSKTTNRYILKILGSSIASMPDWYMEKVFSPECFTIKLKRNSIIFQIASHYVAYFRNMWFYSDKQSEGDNYNRPIDIDLEKIDYCINMVKYDNNIVNNLQTDATMVYETFSPLLHPQVLAVKTPYPSNYPLIINAVTERYK